FEHPIEYAIRTPAEKLAAVREAMRERAATHHLVSALDEIAWLTNLRGSDIEYNPVFLAHLLMGAQSATLFVDREKLEADLRARLSKDGFKIVDYADITQALAALPSGSKLLLDPQRVCLQIAQAIPANIEKIEAELARVRETMRRDGVALVRAARWLEEALARGERPTEPDVDEKLRELRAQQPGF